MSVRDVFNQSIDFVLANARAVRIGVIAAVAIAALVWLHNWKDAIRDDGAQAVRDSVAASTALRLHKKVESSKALADAAIRSARDSAQSLRRAMDRFTDEAAELAAADFAVPKVSVIGDSVRIADDSAIYVVQHPVALWMVNADARLTRQDSLLRVAAFIIREQVPATIGRYETALAKMRENNLNLDSLATASIAEASGLRRQLAASKPSKFQTVLGWAKLGAVAYVAYRVGRGR